ncbi:uncharacterized protein At2g39795, mitochondrial-like [Zingiber officinale]|uniref:uncharacterized protein At2g39795, mitochondrial-like n=1 Tax=Zingiber officinale TaxID=94328 RepID=UPI001C4DAA5F|nr:uncharacterized protein At2g39795, mitochondrial-like [Zingiber officinale]
MAFSAAFCLATSIASHLVACSLSRSLDPRLSTPTSDSNLLQGVDSEIKCALESDDYDRVEEIPSGFPFEIQDEKGINTITLKRNYHGERVSSDLDENMHKSFHKYLEIRGISPLTINFLHEYMINKDSREYLLWFKNLKQFVQK